jgi:hypothetical protein
MNDQSKSSSVPEFNLAMSDIQTELEVAQKNAEVLYQTVCKLEGFELKCDSTTVKSDGPSVTLNTHLHQLREVNGTFSYINAKNNEIITHLQKLI